MCWIPHFPERSSCLLARFRRSLQQCVKISRASLECSISLFCTFYWPIAKMWDAIRILNFNSVLFLFSFWLFLLNMLPSLRCSLSTWIVNFWISSNLAHFFLFSSFWWRFFFSCWCLADNSEQQKEEEIVRRAKLRNKKCKRRIMPEEEWWTFESSRVPRLFSVLSRSFFGCASLERCLTHWL